MNPRHTSELFKRLRRPSVNGRGGDDPQLKLYAQILPGGFLNYGYFDDPGIGPDALSLRDLQRAQIRYGEQLIARIQNPAEPVLDAGCGMGGLTQLLVEHGFAATALSPSPSQCQHVQARHPNLRVIECKFEQLPHETYRRFFGTVIMSESFQYMKLSSALALMDEILKPAGRWILSDYFRTQDSARKSGHPWKEFLPALAAAGWRITSETDITPNVLPMIRYVYMWGTRLAVPAAAFAVAKLEKKRPALHYMLEDVLGELNGYLRDQMEIMNPEIFARDKRYVILVIERSRDAAITEGEGTTEARRTQS